MLPKLAGGFGALDAARERFLAELHRATERQRRYRPEPDAWSMLDVTEHLVLAEERSLLGVLKGPRAGARVTLATHARMALVRLVLMAGIRVQVRITGVHPEGTHSFEALESRWTTARHGLVTAYASLDARAAAGPRFRHPLTGWVSAGEGLSFLAIHIRHHTRQVRRIRAAGGFPPA